VKILSIVVTYYPEEELLKKNIAAFIDDVEKVLIWENTPSQEKEKYRFIHHSKVEYCGDGINSISHGLNYGWKYAKEHEYDYLLTMDQDSLFVNFKFLKRFAEHHHEKWIIIGPALNIKIDEEVLFKEDAATNVETLITSGTFVPIAVLDVLNGYDERLVVDGIDTDLSYRAKSNGIQLLRIEGCSLMQRFGEPVIKSLFGKEYEISSYPPRRLRSILKTHIYLIRKHKNMTPNVRKYIIKHYIVDKTKEIILFEDKKLKKLYSLFYGIIEGLFLRL
jgi:rhamnosyltransferase